MREDIFQVKRETRGIRGRREQRENGVEDVQRGNRSAIGRGQPANKGGCEEVAALLTAL